MKKFLILPTLLLAMHLGATKQELKLESMLTPKPTIQTKPEAKQKSFFVRHFGKIVAATMLTSVSNLICETFRHKIESRYKFYETFYKYVFQSKVYSPLCKSLHIALIYATYKKIESLDPEVN